MTTKKAVAMPARRRVFTAEFKLEMVRPFEARRAQGVSRAQIARELDLSVPMLQSWVRTLARHPDRAVRDVFPGQGRLPSDQEELRRLQRELHRLHQENSFLKVLRGISWKWAAKRLERCHAIGSGGSRWPTTTSPCCLADGKGSSWSV